MKKYLWMSSAAVVIGALRVKCIYMYTILLLSIEENKAWFFMWILCLAEDSLETSSLIFSEKQ